MNERLRQLIQAIGISQKSFAERIKVKQAFISDIVNGRTKGFSIETLSEIAFKFNVNLNWLLTGEGEMFLPGKSPLGKTDGSGIRPPAEINGLGVIEGNVETYPQVDIIEKISRTGWWRKLSPVKKNIVAAVDEIEDQEYLATVDKGLRGKVESDRFQKAIEEAVDKHVPGVRQKGEAG